MLTINDAAQRMGISAETVRRLIRTGKLEAVKNARSKRVLISEDAIAAYSEAHDIWQPVVPAAAGKSTTDAEPTDAPSDQ